MKHVYICEKCGKEYDNWDEAYTCEENHISSFGSGLELEIAKHLQYKPGCRAPSYMILTERKDRWNTETNEQETSFILWKYKLVAELPEQETAEILKEYEENQAAQKKWWEDYEAKQKEAQVDG